MNSDGKTLGQVLRELRCQGGFTRLELAEAAGMSENAVRDYEQGRRMPTLESAVRLAFALGVSLNRLGDTVDREGAYRLPKGQAGRITFGRYKGQLLCRLPREYLEWLRRERPRPLRPEQFSEVVRLLGTCRQERCQPARTRISPAIPQPDDSTERGRALRRGTGG